MTASSSQLGIIAMVTTAILWSIAGLFIKVIDWNPIAIAGLRSLIASIIIVVAVRPRQFTFSRPQVLAAITSTATMMLFVSANKMTTAANAILLQYFAPVLTVFISAAVLKERSRPEHYLAIVFVAGGMLLMFFDKLGGGKLLGNILAIISAVTLSIYFVCMRMQKDGSPIESIVLAHWLTAAICLAISLFLPVPKFTVPSILAIITLGAVQVGVTGLLFAFAIKRISATQANLIAVIEPVCNPLWVFIVLGETPGATALIGGTVVIAAVTASSLVNVRRAS